MFRKLFSKSKQDNLSMRCAAYLKKGSPNGMENYVLDSVTEGIIAHGARFEQLDEELTELCDIVLTEARNHPEIGDVEIRASIMEGANGIKTEPAISRNKVAVPELNVVFICAFLVVAGYRSCAVFRQSLRVKSMF
jgi:hypothetical protein